MTDPYREQEFHEPCVRCEARSVTVCRRCALPLCREHRPRRGRCCDVCEKEYERRVEAGEWNAAKPSPPHLRYLASWIGFSVGCGILALIIAVFPRSARRVAILCAAAVMLATTFWAVWPSRRNRKISRARWWLLERRLRRRFIAEGAKLALPGASEAAEEERRPDSNG